MSAQVPPLGWGFGIFSPSEESLIQSRSPLNGGGKRDGAKCASRPAGRKKGRTAQELLFNDSPATVPPHLPKPGLHFQQLPPPQVPPDPGQSPRWLPRLGTVPFDPHLLPCPGLQSATLSAGLDKAPRVHTFLHPRPWSPSVPDLPVPGTPPLGLHFQV